MHATDLDQYWDALVLAQRTPGTEPLDVETTDLIERLSALGAPTNPDLARERVWRRLQQHRLWEERDMAAGGRVQDAGEAPFGRTSRIGSSASLPSHSSRQAGWRSVMGLMATAALLVLALAGSFLALGPGRSGQKSQAPALIPAMSASPAMPEVDGVASTLLLDLVIPTIGGDKAWVQMDRYTLSPATTMHADVRRNQVPEVFFVMDGALDVRVFDAPQPVRVIRSGGADAEEAIMSGASVALAAGDAIIVPENGAADLMNMTAEPAVALLLFMPTAVAPPVNSGIAFETLVGGILPVSAPVALTLEQATLASGASLPGVDSPTVERFMVPVDPDRVMDARIGSGGSLHNAGDEPLEAYVLTFTSDAPVP